MRKWKKRKNKQTKNQQTNVCIDNKIYYWLCVEHTRRKRGHALPGMAELEL